MVSSNRNPLRIALAVAAARSAIGLKSEAFSLYGEVVEQLLADGEVGEALVHADAMTALDPHDPAGHLKKAECHALLGDIDATVAAAGHAVPLFLERGEVEVALELLERMIAYWPDPACALWAARIHLDRGGQRDGLAALQKLQICFRANPEDLDTLALLARAFDAIGQPEKADRVLEEAARVAEIRGDDDAFARLVELLASRRRSEPSGPWSLPRPSAPPRRAPLRSDVVPKNAPPTAAAAGAGTPHRPALCSLVTRTAGQRP